MEQYACSPEYVQKDTLWNHPNSDLWQESSYQKLYQHRPQIAKNMFFNFCVINEENSVASEEAQGSFSGFFFLDLWQESSYQKKSYPAMLILPRIVAILRYYIYIRIYIYMYMICTLYIIIYIYHICYI